MLLALAWFSRGWAIRARNRHADVFVYVFAAIGTIFLAKLWLKGNDGERDFDYQVWFSDTYVRINGEWRYAFGQASIPL